MRCFSLRKNSYKDLVDIYRKHVILIKAGCFYEARENDAVVIHNIFEYKLYYEDFKFFSRLKAGFPDVALEQVTSILKSHSVSFVVVENYEIVEISHRECNHYDLYTSDKGLPPLVVSKDDELCSHEITEVEENIISILSSLMQGIEPITGKTFELNLLYKNQQISNHINKLYNLKRVKSKF
jgi:hypothetical protein